MDAVHLAFAEMMLPIYRQLSPMEARTILSRATSQLKDMPIALYCAKLIPGVFSAEILELSAKYKSPDEVLLSLLLYGDLGGKNDRECWIYWMRDHLASGLDQAPETGKGLVCQFLREFDYVFMVEMFSVPQLQKMIRSGSCLIDQPEEAATEGFAFPEPEPPRQIFEI